jgi:lipopolysaccharide biosynthesis glycosyltransferase
MKEHKENWRSVATKASGWHFHASHSDQGLMFYWSKYLIQDVTIVISDTVENWKRGPDGDPVRESEVKALFSPYQEKPLVYQWSCEKPYDTRPRGEDRNDWRCFPPIDGFAHFMGNTKPWKQKLRDKDVTKLAEYSYRQKAAKSLWFLELHEINTKFEMGLDMDNWDSVYPELMKNDTLGVQAQYGDQLDVLGLVKSDLQKDSRESHEVADTRDQSDMKSLAESDKSSPPVVAYAVSFIKCGDHQNNAAGLIDASLVLRHSIHKISSRNPESGSKYDYKMYAIVHRQAQACSQVLEKSGFEVIVVDPPFDKSEIKGDFLRSHIHKERCCGHDEFIKLHAYKLPEDVIVHVDIDFALYKPMDSLFDAILHDKDSFTGQAARKALQLERPGEALPDKIGAFITRDWPQVIPGKWPAGYQAGFLVARRDPSIAEEMVAVIKEGNYTEGWGYGHGWGNKGYAGWVGAMAMQGLVAYYYDHIRPGNAVELNHCMYNHMGMDVRHKGKCRNGSDKCEDCMQTKMKDIYSMHYTMCRKPWLCQAIGAPGGKKPDGGRGSALNTNSVNVEHCLEMAQQWHSLRSDLEASLLELTNDELIKEGASGTYKPDVFHGHCDGDGDAHYLKIAGNSLGRIQELYLD